MTRVDDLRLGFRLTSIPGAVIELSPAPVGGDVDWRDLGKCLAVTCRLLVDLNWPSMLNPPESCKDPQVIAVSPSALSGFRLRPPAGGIQEDSLKPRSLSWSAPSQGHWNCAQLAPGNRG